MKRKLNKEEKHIEIQGTYQKYQFICTNDPEVTMTVSDHFRAMYVCQFIEHFVLLYRIHRTIQDTYPGNLVQNL